MRFRLRTLMIVLTLGPPMLAGAWFAARFAFYSAAHSILAVILTTPICLAVTYAAALVFSISRKK